MRDVIVMEGLCTFAELVQYGLTLRLQSARSVTVSTIAISATCRDACSVDWRPAWLRSPWIASTGCGVCALRLRASSSAAAFARTRTQVSTHARGLVWGPGQSYLGRYKHEDSALLQKVRQTLREPRPFQVGRLQHLDHLQSLITISNQQRQSVSSKVVSALGA